jgi:hypothetical protein
MVSRGIATAGCALTVALWTGAACAQTVNADEAGVLARAFAPMLVFHAAERYFPVSPLFPMDTRSEPWDDDQAIAELGTPDERVRVYDELTRDDKIAHASLAYRVFATTAHGRPRVAVEFWCHYVFNDYTFRGGLVGWSAEDNHINDLERVIFELERIHVRGPISSIDSARRAYVIRRIIASAHDGSVSANVLDVDPARPVTPPVAIVVEKGSHAMAPDVNDDGRITQGIDVNDAKFLWGIRDHGEGGVRYRPVFTDERTTGARLCDTETSAIDHRCDPYALQSAEELQEWFHGPNLTESARDRSVGRTGWLFRWFGDVKVEELRIPRDRATRDVITSMTDRRASQEGGLSIGTTVGRSLQPLALGARWAWITPGRWTPDLLASGQVLLDNRLGAVGTEVSAMGFYQLDLVTKALAGVTWVERLDIPQRTLDVLVGVEFRIGRLRIRPNTTVRGVVKGTQFSLVF